MMEPDATEAPHANRTLRPISQPVVAVSGANDDPAVTTAIERGGGALGPLDRADALVHLGDVDELPTLPDRIRWVQLPAAGIEAYLDDRRVDRKRIWTSAAGAYAATVAEHAVALLLAGVRGLVTSARSNGWRPEVVEPRVTGLAGTTVAIVGAGGIGRRASELLVCFGASVIAVNRSGSAVPGAVRTVPAHLLDDIWGDVDHVILAAPATDATRGLIDAKVLAKLSSASWIVNVARGPLIDNDALIDAASAERIAGALLDVTDPEPLPDEHPLWNTPGILITPHIANPPQLLGPALNERIRENVARYAEGRELLGVIDLDAGY